MSRSDLWICISHVGLVMVLVLCLGIVFAAFPGSVKAAPAWPGAGSWRLIDTDADEPGGANHRDVVEAYWTCDAVHEYVFLRLRTVQPPNFSGGATRYKWLIDVGSGLNLYQSGGVVLGSDYLLFVEDSDGDGVGEIYLVPASPDDRYGDYEPWDGTNAAPITDADVADYLITGNYIDMYVAFSAVGKT